MKKPIVSILVMMALAWSGRAQNVTPQDAAAAGSSFLNQHTTSFRQKSAANLELAYTAPLDEFQKSSGNACYYVFNVKGGGFVIVSASRNILPILAYAPEGRFDTTGMPTNFRYLLDAMREEITDAVVRQIPASESVSSRWDLLLQPTAGIQFNEKAESVEPLTSRIMWDQWPYYNDSCPKDGKVSSVYYGGRCPAGCTATAMAIVIRYWKYPIHGYGSHSYRHSTYGLLSANFGNTTYKYANMPEYFGALPKAYQRSATAQLLYHCGVATDMTYSPTGSGAYVYAYWNENAQDARNAFRNYFGYRSASGERKINFNDTQWKNLLKSQLREQQPVIFSGYSPTGGGAGHAFVCDGFDKNDLFHFNWGWGGSYNCYCTIDSLCPGGIGTGGGNGNYSKDQSVVINLNPYKEEQNFGWVSSDAYSSVSPDTLCYISLQPDTLQHVYSKESSHCAKIHSIGTVFDPTADDFGTAHSDKLFQNPYRMDSLRIRYQYRMGSMHSEDSAPDTLYIYLSYYIPGTDTNYRDVVSDGSHYLSPKVLSGPTRPQTLNSTCIRYLLTETDAQKNQLSIPINYGKATALGFDVPENAVLNTMIRYVPAGKYRDGDTLCLVENGNSIYIRNCFSLACLYKENTSFSDRTGRNAALMEGTSLRYRMGNDSSDRCYAPSARLLPRWEYHFRCNTIPVSAYTELDTAFCGSTNWNGIQITENGDYRQVFTAADGKDSIVVLHITCDDPIGKVGQIQGKRPEGLGDYTFCTEPVTGAASYRWILESPQWSLENEDSLCCMLHISEKGQGVLGFHAYSAHGGCHEFRNLKFIFCDSMGNTSAGINGQTHFNKKSYATYSLDPIPFARKYRWFLSGSSDWSICSDSSLNWVTLQINSSGLDTLYVDITDECGYNTRKSMGIACELGISNTNNPLNILAYPNPAYEQLHVVIPENTGNCTYRFTDAVGRLLLEGKATEGHFTLEISSFVKGMYFLQITNEEQKSSVCKIIRR